MHTNSTNSSVRVSNLLKEGFQKIFKQYMSHDDADPKLKAFLQVLSDISIENKSILELHSYDYAAAEKKLEKIQRRIVGTPNFVENFESNLKQFKQSLLKIFVYPLVKKTIDELSEWLKDVNITRKKENLNRIAKYINCLKEVLDHLETQINMTEDEITKNADETKTIELIMKLIECLPVTLHPNQS